LWTFLEDKTPRIIRFLRPILLVVHFKAVRRIYRIFIHVIIEAKEFMFMLLLCQLLFAAVGMDLFAEDYNELSFATGDDPYLHLDQSSCNQTTLESTANCDLRPWVFKSFSNLYRSHITLIVLLTSENYPEVLWPPYAVNHFSVIYFVVYLLLVYFFLLNIVFAVMFQNYNKAYLYIRREEELIETTALKNAWDLLNYRGEPALPVHVVEDVIQKVRRNYNTEQVKILVSNLDQDNNNLIMLWEWRKLVDRLLHEIKFHDNVNMWGQISKYDITSNFSMCSCLRVSNNSSFRRITFVVKDTGFVDYFLRTIELTDVVILLLWKDVDTFYAANLICCGISFLNEVVKILVFREGLLAAIYSYQSYFILVLIEMIGVVIGYADRGSKFQVLRFCGIFKLSPLCVWISNKWKLLYARYNWKLLWAKLMKEENAFVDAEKKEEQDPPFTENDITITSLFHVLQALSSIFLLFFCSVFFVLIYTWMILGMELFNGNGVVNRCSAIDEMANYPDARFCDGSRTVLLLFQILTTNDWHQIMYNTMDKYGEWAALYFIVFVFLGPMLLVFLLIAFVWDFYFEEFKKIESEKNNNADPELSNSSVNDDVSSYERSSESDNGADLKSDEAYPGKTWNKNFSKYRVQRPNNLLFKQRQIGNTKKNEETLQREKSAIMNRSTTTLWGSERSSDLLKDSWTSGRGVAPNLGRPNFQIQ